VRGSDDRDEDEVDDEDDGDDDDEDDDDVDAALEEGHVHPRMNKPKHCVRYKRFTDDCTPHFGADGNDTDVDELHACTSTLPSGWHVAEAQVLTMLPNPSKGSGFPQGTPVG
jgi:hypothetical protein